MGLVLAAALFVIGWTGANFYYVPFGWYSWPLVFLIPDLPGQWTDVSNLWGASAVAGLLVLMFIVGWKSAVRNQKTLLVSAAAGLLIGDLVGGSGYWTYLYNALVDNEPTSYSSVQFVAGITIALTSVLLVVAAMGLGAVVKRAVRQSEDAHFKSVMRKRTFGLVAAAGLVAGFLGSAPEYGRTYAFYGLHLSGAPYLSIMSMALLSGLIVSPAVVIAVSYLVGRRATPALGQLSILLVTFVAALWGFLFGFLFFMYETFAANVDSSRALSYLVARLGDIPGNAPTAASFSLWLSLVGFGAFLIPYLVRRGE
jgi:hypothetical protein